MKSPPTTFGLLHIPTKRFARFDSVDRTVFHRLKPGLLQTIYRDEEDELSDRARFYEADYLSTVLKVLAAEPNRFGYREIDDGYGRLVINDDLSQFSPIAFVRRASRLHGTGDYMVGETKVQLVINVADCDTSYDRLSYDLADIPTEPGVLA